MGEKRRCLSDAILCNDNFMTLPNSAKILYIYINQKTDDKGFCDEVVSIMGALKSKKSDLMVLIEREYLIQVKPWLFLETHFWINNKNLRKDRISPSRFEKHLKEYDLDERGQYVVNLTPNDNQMTSNGVKMTPQDNINKDKINKDKLINNINNSGLPDELTESHRRFIERQ